MYKRQQHTHQSAALQHRKAADTVSGEFQSRLVDIISCLNSDGRAGHEVSGLICIVTACLLYTSGGCKGILPLSIVRKKGGMIGYYSTSGYIRLSDLHELTVSGILTVAEETVAAIQECGQYLIFPEEYVINTDTVYIREDFKQIKFTYIPDRYSVSGRKKFSAFLEQLKDMTTENGRMYLDMLSQLSDTENLSLMKMKAFISRLKREAGIYGIS